MVNQYEFHLSWTVKKKENRVDCKLNYAFKQFAALLADDLMQFDMHAYAAAIPLPNAGLGLIEAREDHTWTPLLFHYKG